MSGPKADAILARSGDPTIKKRKKKPKNEDYTAKLEEGEGLRMRDEDEWNRGNGDDVDMDADADAPGQSSCYLSDRVCPADTAEVVGKALATFNKSKSTWSTVGATSLPLASQPSEAGPSSRPATEDQDADIKPDIDSEGNQPKKVVTKRKGGLRTAAQIREEAEALKAEQAAAAAAAAEAAGDDEDGGRAAMPQGPSQTVHRDSSGRIVDVEKLKREAKDKEDEERWKAREREEWSKGLIQRQRQENRAKEEAEMGRTDVARSVVSLRCSWAGLTVFRYANDASINRELREVERWNDPAAEFLTVSSFLTCLHVDLTRIQRRRKPKGPKRPKYTGPWAQNRFSIPPGFRWDGVGESPSSTVYRCIKPS